MKKVKIGVLGGYRGKTMMNYCLSRSDSELVAVCDRDDEVLGNCDSFFKEQNACVTLYKDFDDFLHHPMDAVIIANYADDHAPFAVKALRSGFHVLSENIAVETLKEAVELCEAVEESGKVYAYGENFAYMQAPLEMKRLYDAGELGEFEYAEAEYVHDCEEIWPAISYGNPGHWRNRCNAFFYCTHSVGPMLHVTGLRPVRVSGFEIPRNEKMDRMGALGATGALEIVTMENGGVCKSLHGLGISGHVYWSVLYGTHGRVEAVRPGIEVKGSVLVDLDDQCRGETTGDTAPRRVQSLYYPRRLPGAENYTHDGGDFYTMYHFVRAINGEENDSIGVYEALDMTFAGMFGYFSALAGGAPMDIPNFRIPAEREKYRYDTRCSNPAKAGGQLLPTTTKGTPAVEQASYDRIKRLFEDSRRLDLFI